MPHYKSPEGIPGTNNPIPEFIPESERVSKYNAVIDAKTKKIAGEDAEKVKKSRLTIDKGREEHWGSEELLSGEIDGHSIMILKQVRPTGDLYYGTLDGHCLNEESDDAERLYEAYRHVADMQQEIRLQTEDELRGIAYEQDKDREDDGVQAQTIEALLKLGTEKE